MEIEFTIKIKDKYHPPALKEILGSNIVAKVTIDFKHATEENYEHPRFLQAVHARGRELLDDYFEISFDLEQFNVK